MHVEIPAAGGDGVTKDFVAMISCSVSMCWPMIRRVSRTPMNGAAQRK